MPTTLKVLVVDDERAIRALTSLQLGRCGYEVDDAADGEEALALIGANRYDVIVSDFEMPGMTGLEFLRAARQSCPSVATVIFCGKRSTEADPEWVDEWLEKPSSEEAIVQAIHAALGKHSSDSAASA